LDANSLAQNKENVFLQTGPRIVFWTCHTTLCRELFKSLHPTVQCTRMHVHVLENKPKNVLCEIWEFKINDFIFQKSATF